MHTFDMKWQETADGKFLIYGDESRCVRIKQPEPGAGYLWVHKKQFGYAETIEAAKNWVEAAAEFYPRKLY